MKTKTIRRGAFTARYKAQNGAFVMTTFTTPAGLFSGDMCDDVHQAESYCRAELAKLQQGQSRFPTKVANAALRQPAT